MKAYQPIKDSMVGSGPMPLIFLNKRAAELWAKDHDEEWTNYKVKEVEYRMPTEEEGVVDGQLVQIHRERVEVMLRERALKKLTAEERRILGLQNVKATDDRRLESGWICVC